MSTDDIMKDAEAASKFVAANVEAWANLDDEEKMNCFNEHFKAFSMQFPIVSKYMVCLRVFNAKAFSNLVKRGHIIDKKEWVRSRATYIKQVYQFAYRLTGTELRKIKRTAITELTNEFTSFDELYKEKAAKVKEDKLRHKRERIAEMLQHMRTFTPEQQTRIKQYVQSGHARAVYDRVVAELQTRRVKNVNSIEGEGTNVHAREVYDSELRIAEVKKTHTQMQL